MSDVMQHGIIYRNIKFNNGSLNLSIDSGKVKLGGQEITLISSNIEIASNEEDIILPEGDTTFPIEFKWRKVEGVEEYELNLVDLVDNKWNVDYSSKDLVEVWNDGQWYGGKVNWNAYGESLAIGRYSLEISYYDSHGNYQVLGVKEFNIIPQCVLESFRVSESNYYYRKMCIDQEGKLSKEGWFYEINLNGGHFKYEGSSYEDKDKKIRLFKIHTNYRKALIKNISCGRIRSESTADMFMKVIKTEGFDKGYYINTREEYVFPSTEFQGNWTMSGTPVSLNLWKSEIVGDPNDQMCGSSVRYYYGFDWGADTTIWPDCTSSGGSERCAYYLWVTHNFKYQKCFNSAFWNTCTANECENQVVTSKRMGEYDSNAVVLYE